MSGLWQELDEGVPAFQEAHNLVGAGEANHSTWPIVISAMRSIGYSGGT